MCEDNRKVKLGYILAEAMWFVYAADNGFLGMYAVHLVMICAGLFSLYRNKTIKSFAKNVCDQSSLLKTA